MCNNNCDNCNRIKPENYSELGHALMIAYDKYGPNSVAFENEAARLCRVFDDIQRAEFENTGE